MRVLLTEGIETMKATGGVVLRGERGSRESQGVVLHNREPLDTKEGW